MPASQVGTLTLAGDSVILTTTHYDTLGVIGLSGTYTAATVTCSVSFDGGTSYFPLAGTRQTNGSLDIFTAPVALLPSESRAWKFDTSKATNLKIVLNAIGSGSIAVEMFSDAFFVNSPTEITVGGINQTPFVSFAGLLAPLYPGNSSQTNAQLPATTLTPVNNSVNYGVHPTGNVYPLIADETGGVYAIDRENRRRLEAIERLLGDLCELIVWLKEPGQGAPPGMSGNRQLREADRRGAA